LFDGVDVHQTDFLPYFNHLYHQRSIAENSTLMCCSGNQICLAKGLGMSGDREINCSTFAIVTTITSTDYTHCRQCNMVNKALLPEI
jgi:hypothetical protein